MSILLKCIYLPGPPCTSRHVLKSALAVSLPHRSCIVLYTFLLGCFTTVSCFLIDQCMPSAGADCWVIQCYASSSACGCVAEVSVYCIHIVKVRQGSGVAPAGVLLFCFGLFCFRDRRCDLRSRFDMVVSGWLLHHGEQTLESNDKVWSLCVPVRVQYHMAFSPEESQLEVQYTSSIMLQISAKFSSTVQ